MDNEIFIVTQIKKLVYEISKQILDINSLKEIEKEVTEKGKNNYVTTFDIKVENKLKTALKELIVESTFLGEETGGKIESKGYTWVVDPIDGTTNFIHGLQYAISIGLVKYGKPIIGCIYSPSTEDFWYGIKGKGAYKNDIKLQVSQRDSIKDTVIEFGFPYDTSKTENILKNVLKIKQAGAADVKRIGPACLDICRVASGECDAYFEYDLKPWDIMAAMLILQEAGGTLYKMDGTKYEFTQGSIIVSNKSEKLKKQLLELIN